MVPIGSMPSSLAPRPAERWLCGARLTSREDSHPVNLQMPGPSLEKMGKDTSLELFTLR